jgi:hypothetical protein
VGRRVLLARRLAVVLVVGVAIGAWATIPSSDGFIHGCYGTTPSQLKPFYLLDKDQGNCPNGYVEVRLVGTSP